MCTNTAAMANLIAILFAPIPFYFACISAWVRLMGHEFPWPDALAATFATTAVYAGDRIEGKHASVRSQLLLTVVVNTVAFFAVAVPWSPHLIWSAAKLIPVAVFYGTPIPGTGVCLKNLFPCSKTVVVPAMHVAWSVMASRVVAPAPEAVMAMWLHFVALNVLMDLKDVQEDRACGTVTVPTLFGEARTIHALLALDLACVACFRAPAVRCLFWMDCLWTSRYLRPGAPPTNQMFPVWCSLLPIAAAFAAP